MKILAATPASDHLSDPATAVQPFSLALRDWESRHFGIRMGALLCSTDHRLSDSDWSCALQQSIAQARDAGVNHLTLTLPADCPQPRQTLTALGFVHTDEKQTYVARPAPQPRRKGFFTVRDYCAEDRDAVVALIRQTHLPSRFSHDATFEHTAVQDWYVTWLDRLQQESANGGVLVVAEKQGQVVGCGGLSRKTDNPLALGNSLLVCAPQAAGAGYALAARGINDGLKTADQIEFSTSASNSRMIRVLLGLDCTLASTEQVYALSLAD